MKIGAAILAAGSGSRFGSDKTKLVVGNKPLWKWSYDTFKAHPDINEVIIIAGENFEEISADSDLKVLRGGSSRQESSRIACEFFSDEIDFVLIHDAARPFVSQELISRVIVAGKKSGAAAPATPVRETVRRIVPQKCEIIDRTNLFLMETPQGALKSKLIEAHAQATGRETDEMSLIEAIGLPWTQVLGDPHNFKVTYPEDIEKLNSHPMSNRLPEIRTGLGYDVHAFSTDPHRPMWLGGVLFPNEVGLEGHSDADALLHAAVDALLGAAGMGDIGHYFPPSEPQWKNAKSIRFLEFAFEKIQADGWAVVNLDCSVIAERPKIRVAESDIRAVIGNALKIDASRVGLKATTNEGLGAIGRGEGLAAFVIVTLTRS